MTERPTTRTDIGQTAFAQIARLIGEHAAARPAATALIQAAAAGTPQRHWDYATLDAFMDRVAAALQRDGIGAGHAIAICAGTTIEYAGLFLGALRAGVVVAPLAPSATADQLARMAGDAQARLLFADADTPPLPVSTPRVLMPGTATPPTGAAAPALDQWLAPAGARPQPVELAPQAPFNIIYSSGTTGEPKGIVQPHGMRWAHVQRGVSYGYGPDTVTLLSTPLYSNTTLVVFFPTLAFGGTVALMARFDAAHYLEIAQRLRVTHTMLVPVQYQRLMARPDFDSHDLRSYRFKFCTSAPFGADLKADVLRRWPGGLVEFYGMTEGGGTCILDAHARPDKLHTVGRPAAGSDIRLIDEEGRELSAAQLSAGVAGEVVGHSPGMMVGYHGQPARTREVEWFDAQGKRFIRTGDVGRFDADGFLVLMDRRKDMIISGGFNIYPSDLESVMREHPAVADVAVVGVPSTQWGETPIAAVVRCAGRADTAEELLAWANARLGKTQRLSGVWLIDELPRSAIGKVLKRELRESYVGTTAFT